MKHILGIFIGVIVWTSTVAADDLFFETETAFEASQAARNKGVAAFRDGDYATALTHMEEALRHRPNHPLLLGYVAYLSAESGQPDRAAEAAKAYAAMKLAPGAGIRDALKKALSDDAGTQIENLFAANEHPQGVVTTKFMLPADMALVEGIAFGPDGKLFVSTVVSGGIYRMDAVGPVKILDAKQHSFGSLFGMIFHAGSLYATFAHIEQTPGFREGEGQTGIVRLNPDDGTIMQVWTLPPADTPQQLADITVTRTGDIYATDAQGKKVYRLTGDTLFPLFAHKGFMSPQGIAETRDGQLIMADYGRGLWRLDSESGAAILLGTPKNVSLHGIDGLVRHGDKLIALQNGVTPQRLLELSLFADGWAVAAAHVAAQGFNAYGEPTLGVSTPDGFYFIGGSQWPNYGEGGVLKDGAEAKPTPVMKLEN